ncbi:MAG: energy-coupling factor transporter transmembrane component T family protein [Propionibacteriaceae bacterium]
MSFLDRVNPVTRLAAAVIVTTPLIFSLDRLSPTIQLGLAVPLLLLAGARGFWRLLPVVIFAPLAGVSLLLYADQAGEIYWRWGPMCISAGSIAAASAMTIRVLACTVPVILLFAGIDPTELGDGLAQLCKLPARFVLGSLAGVRTVGLIRSDQRMIVMARRARGLGDGNRLRRFWGMAFGLLVISLRRGSTLATAMEARGFGRGERTWARPAKFHMEDVIVAVASVAVITIAVVVAVWQGQWSPLWD